MLQLDFSKIKEKHPDLNVDLLEKKIYEDMCKHPEEYGTIPTVEEIDEIFK